MMGEMAPYLLFGFLIAGLLSVFVSQRMVERHLGGQGVGPVLKATLFGIPLPLCSCGVIPVAASLRKKGASRGATTSFLLSTPQTGVDSILVTLSLLGPVFTIFRPLAALVTGFFGGMLVNWFDPEESITNNFSKPENKKEDINVSEIEHRWLFRTMHYGFVELPRDISKALVIGLLIAGVISAIIPNDYFAGSLGTGMTAKLVMMLIGIPMYVCATGSVPVAAALIAKGISPGAALVFLITGPGTNAATISTIWKTMGKRTALIYLGTVAIGSLLAGVVLDWIYVANEIPQMFHVHDFLPRYIKNISAIILMGVLAFGYFYNPGKIKNRKPEHELKEFKENENLHSVTLKIEGMTCAHCAETVRSLITSEKGVHSAEVNLKKHIAIVTGTILDIESMYKKIEDAGYRRGD